MLFFIFRYENKNINSYHIKKHLASSNGHRRQIGSDSNWQPNYDDALQQICQSGNSNKSQAGPHNSGEDESITPRDEMRKKTKQLHQVLNNNKRRDPTQLQLKSIDTVLVSEEAQKTNAESVMHVKSETESTSSKKTRSLKHVSLSPDHRSLSGNESSGVELCKKLFGITVLEYSNGKGARSRGGKSSKLVVQTVMEGSSSYTSGRIHRG